MVVVAMLTMSAPLSEFNHRVPPMVAPMKSNRSLRSPPTFKPLVGRRSEPLLETHGESPGSVAPGLGSKS
jgi:hypothetical protein